MDILKRSLAPITEEAWNEIDKAARDVLMTQLSARKIVDVDGPRGLDFAAVVVGRLDMPKKSKDGEVRYGIQKVQPLVETRIPFELDIWELDDVIRGAKDVDFDPLEEAARKMAVFEENAAYHGFQEANIKGLLDGSSHKPLEFDTGSAESFLEAISGAVALLTDTYIEGPYALAISPSLWHRILADVKDYPLRQHVQNIIDGNIVFTPNIKDALLISTRGGDFELTLGMDFSVGYQSHGNNKVTLFFTESFTFRILEPRALVSLKGK